MRWLPWVGAAGALVSGALTASTMFVGGPTAPAVVAELLRYLSLGMLFLVWGLVLWHSAAIPRGLRGLRRLAALVDGLPRWSIVLSLTVLVVGATLAVAATVTEWPVADDDAAWFVVRTAAATAAFCLGGLAAAGLCARLGLPA